MGFESVERSTNFTKSSELKVGESFVGYFVGYDLSKFKGPNGEEQYNLVFQDEKTGEKIVMSASGNLKYSHKDNILKEGLLTRITRKEDVRNKKGQMRHDFTREQDASKKIKVESLGTPVRTNRSEVNRVKENIDKLGVEG